MLMSKVGFIQANVSTRHDIYNSKVQANVATRRNISIFASRAARAREVYTYCTHLTDVALVVAQHEGTLD